VLFRCCIPRRRKQLLEREAHHQLGLACHGRPRYVALQLRCHHSAWRVRMHTLWAPLHWRPLLGSTPLASVKSAPSARRDSESAPAGPPRLEFAGGAAAAAPQGSQVIQRIVCPPMKQRSLQQAAPPAVSWPPASSPLSPADSTPPAGSVFRLASGEAS
jgi:hypothetical protein